MIDKQNVLNLIQDKLQGTGYELITFQVNAQNEILVEVDKLEGVDVDFCATLTSVPRYFLPSAASTSTSCPRCLVYCILVTKGAVKLTLPTSKE